MQVRTLIKKAEHISENEFEENLASFKILFGKRVKYFRELKNFTQEYLAELADIEQSSLSNIERGRVYPSAETLYRLAVALEVQPYQFYTVKPEIPVQDIIKEMSTAMYRDKKLADLIYKFFRTVL